MFPWHQIKNEKPTETTLRNGQYRIWEEVAGESFKKRQAQKNACLNLFAEVTSASLISLNCCKCMSIFSV